MHSSIAIPKVLDLGRALPRRVAGTLWRRCRLFFTRFIKSHQEDNHFARQVLRNFEAAAYA
jgi:hypothetical protein